VAVAPSRPPPPRATRRASIRSGGATCPGILSSEPPDLFRRRPGTNLHFSRRVGQTRANRWCVCASGSDAFNALSYFKTFPGERRPTVAWACLTHPTSLREMRTGLLGGSSCCARHERCCIRADAGHRCFLVQGCQFTRHRRGPPLFAAVPSGGSLRSCRVGGDHRNLQPPAARRMRAHLLTARFAAAPGPSWLRKK
jgi:hypothetical protein